MSKQAVPTYSPSPPRRDARGDDRDRGAANMMQEVQVWVWLGFSRHRSTHTAAAQNAASVSLFCNFPIGYRHATASEEGPATSSQHARSKRYGSRAVSESGWRRSFGALHDLAGAQQQLPRKPQLPPAPPASKEGKAAGHAGRKLTFSESAWAITANSLGRRSADEGKPADDEVPHGEESSSAGDHQPVAASTSTYGAIPLAPARRRPIAHPVDEGPAEPLLYAHLALPADLRDDGSFAISDDAGEPIWAREQLLRGRQYCLQRPRAWVSPRRFDGSRALLSAAWRRTWAGPRAWQMASRTQSSHLWARPFRMSCLGASLRSLSSRRLRPRRHGCPGMS